MIDRVPMPSRRPAFIADDEIAATITKQPNYARRFSMDVSEEALAQMGQRVIPVVAEDIAKRAVWNHQADIERAVYSYINNPEWAEPIIRAAIFAAVLQFVRETFGPEKETP